MTLPDPLTLHARTGRPAAPADAMPALRAVRSARSGCAQRCTALLVALTLVWAPPVTVAAEVASVVSSLPNLGDSSSDELSPLAERRLGEDIMRQIRAASDDLDDPETVEYLNLFAAALTSRAPPGSPGFEFFAVKDASINAFALPGGFIGVHSGLLLAAQSESELASVLGHEIGHVTQRHIARSLSDQKQTSMVTIAAMALALLAARSGNSQITQAAVAGSMGFAAQSQLGFSREAEREADRVGLQFLGDAGFDVTGMVDFFGRMQQASRYYERAAPAYLRTHPLSTERIADIQNRIRDVRYRQRADSPEFQLIRARIRVLQDETGQGLREARLNFEEQARNGHAALQPAAHYGLALVAARQRDYGVARRELGRARTQLRVRSPVLEKFAIELMALSGQPDGAVQLANAARNDFPQSRMIAVAFAEALQQASRHPEAVGYLRDQIGLYRQDPNLYMLLAKSHAALGNALQEHKALAESYYIRGNLRAALTQLQFARRAPGADFYEASQIDARTREVQALILERDRVDKANGRR